MLGSLLLAWGAALLTVMEALRFAARISKRKSLNRFFHAIHIPFGVLLLPVGALHGVLAGNAPGTRLSDVMLAPVLFTPNWGTLCYVLAVLLGASYLLRRRLKKGWMPLHRLLTVLMLLTLSAHLLHVGIQLPDRLAQRSALGTQQLPAVEDAPLLAFSGAALKDGIYEGTAEGYRGNITVSVSVTDGRVTDITVVRQSDTPQYFARAESVIDTVLSEQSLAVDAVSGATYSSEGIKNAVYAALQSAVTDGELSITHAQTRGGKRRPH